MYANELNQDLIKLIIKANRNYKYYLYHSQKYIQIILTLFYKLFFTNIPNF